MKHFLRFAVSALAAGVILSCARSRDDGGLPLHAVIDAGSSGTRICLFAVKKDGDACHAVDTEFGCKDVPAEDGLADIGPERTTQVVRSALALVQSDSKRIQGAALLGTGGFRRAQPARQTEVMRAAGSVLLEQGYPSTVRVIQGEEEGRLAWFSIAEAKGSRAHRTLEIGGATVQLTTGTEASVRAISTPDGLNDSAKKLGDKSACFHPGTEDAHKVCVTEIRDRVFLNSRLSDFAMGFSAAEKALPLYGLGAPWNAVFGRAGKTELTVEDIDRQAAMLCGKTIQELSTMMKPEYAARACYLNSYAGELLRVAGAKTVLKGNESWPRGASVAPEYFADCRKQ